MKISKVLQQRIQKAVNEKVDIVPYDPNWSQLFIEEATFLKKKFPKIINRVEHFGSTAVFGLSAKPVVDMLIEVTSYKDVKENIVPYLESLGYDYFWRPEIDKPPMYAWFIKRNKRGERTHHLHMIRRDSKLWDRLYFRDYLREFPEEAEKYGRLKTEISKEYSNDREAYTKAKTEFVTTLTEKAKQHYKKLRE